MHKAVFYDQDGIILKMIYDRESDLIHPPLNEAQISYAPHIFQLCKVTKKRQFKNIIISNQPNVGLGRMSKKVFTKITEHIRADFAMRKVPFDDFNYCLHHPYAEILKYKKRCFCRKPKPGLFLQAAKKNQIDLSLSWVIGDGAGDIIAGHTAGCRTILLGNPLESEYLRVLQVHLKGIKPDYIVKNLNEAIEIIK